MQQQQFPRIEQQPADVLPSTPVSDVSRSEIARRAYLSYLDDGSLPGREEQHWLEAEAKLHAEIINGGHHHSA
jgi:hypothetical protein